MVIVLSQANITMNRLIFIHFFFSVIHLREVRELVEAPLNDILSPFPFFKSSHALRAFTSDDTFLDHLKQRNTHIHRWIGRVK